MKIEKRGYSGYHDDLVRIAEKFGSPASDLVHQLMLAFSYAQTGGPRETTDLRLAEFLADACRDKKVRIEEYFGLATYFYLSKDKKPTPLYYKSRSQLSNRIVFLPSVEKQNLFVVADPLFDEAVEIAVRFHKLYRDYPGVDTRYLPLGRDKEFTYPAILFHLVQAAENALAYQNGSLVNLWD